MLMMSKMKTTTSMREVENWWRDRFERGMFFAKKLRDRRLGHFWTNFMTLLQLEDGTNMIVIGQWYMQYSYSHLLDIIIQWYSIYLRPFIGKAVWMIAITQDLTLWRIRQDWSFSLMCCETFMIRWPTPVFTYAVHYKNTLPHTLVDPIVQWCGWWNKSHHEKTLGVLTLVLPTYHWYCRENPWPKQRSWMTKLLHRRTGFEKTTLKRGYFWIYSVYIYIYIFFFWYIKKYVLYLN